MTQTTLDDLRKVLMKPTDLNRMSRPLASRDPGPGKTYFPGTFPEDGRAADPDNLEGPGPTDEERRANARAISALSIPERFALMFGHRTDSP